MPSTMPVIPEWLRADAGGRPIGVDRGKKAILGFVVAQAGPFKSVGRGEFDDSSLRSIVQLMATKPKGTKSRFTHPSLSEDGLGNYVGRAREPRLDSATTDSGATVAAVRADLYLSPAAFVSPKGDLGTYVLDLADDDSDALSSSLVLQVKREVRLNADGSRQTDAAGNALPPLWRPEKIHATDIVDTGDAVDGLLSASVLSGELPDAAVRHASEMLDRLFAGQTRDVVEARCSAWLDRYLGMRYGPEPIKSVDVLRRRLALLTKSL